MTAPASSSDATIDFSEHSHRRFNPLTRSWVLCSPHRMKRPWLGSQEPIAPSDRPKYDPKCYLCPGNKRANGEVNPEYDDTFIFDNDFPAVKADQPSGLFGMNKDGTVIEDSNPLNSLLVAESTRGKCSVVCFTPSHNLTIAELSVDQISKIVQTWTKEYKRLGKIDYVRSVQIFENKGAIMGCSNPHPHGQIWATEMIPEESSKELDAMKDYLKAHNSHLLADYASLEIRQISRLVHTTSSFIAVVPFWAVWPFETLILPKCQKKNLSELNEQEVKDLAECISIVTIKYDNLFECEFPYSMGIHQAPTDGNEWDQAYLHVHFYPPLLRSATVKKFLVGFEMLGEPQRDLTAEQAAERLRNLPSVHYKRQ
ncbi:galactose-1-phosphate uridylyltransferase [Paraphysoderma sedebokerense]|nr:galactose-1-phosphate uridylyltransferase [Paraphysoderma sedebokerense]